MSLTETTRTELRALTQRYPVARAALLPMLHLVQSHEGFVSEDGIGMCAEVLGLTKAEVGAVATFYSMYKREPVGDYLLSVCTNPTCKIAGGQDIYEGWVAACGGGHTDAEAGVMVEHAECLGICDSAPVVQINYEMYGPVTVDEGVDLLAKAKAKTPPPSNRSGETPEVFTAVERQLSGIDDGVHDHLVEAARLQATSEVPPSYRTGETDIPVTHPGGDPFGHGGQAFASAARFDLVPDATPTPDDVSRTDAALADDPTGGVADASTAAAVDAEGAYGDEVRDTSDGEAPGQDASIGAEHTTDEEGSDRPASEPSSQPADAPEAPVAPDSDATSTDPEDRS